MFSHVFNFSDEIIVIFNLEWIVCPTKQGIFYFVNTIPQQRVFTKTKQNKEKRSRRMDTRHVSPTSEVKPHIIIVTAWTSTVHNFMAYRYEAATEGKTFRLDARRVIDLSKFPVQSVENEAPTL